MEPEQVYLGIEELFAIEAEVDRLRKELYTEYVSVATVLAAGQYAIVEVLRLASGRWCHQRSLGFTGLVGVLGEYLAMCAAEAVEIDEFRSRLHYDNTSRDNMALSPWPVRKDKRYGGRTYTPFLRSRRSRDATPSTF